MTRNRWDLVWTIAKLLCAACALFAGSIALGEPVTIARESIVSPAATKRGLVRLASVEQAKQIAEDDLAYIKSQVPTFDVITLPLRAGLTELQADVSLTIEELRGITIDPAPPDLGEPRRAYSPQATDGLPAGTAPYVADEISPFRMRYFHCILDYGGAYNLSMIDYASAHGFNTLKPGRGRKTYEWQHLPSETWWYSAGPGTKWQNIPPGKSVPDGRFDLFDESAERHDLKAIAATKHALRFQKDRHLKMIDIEHLCLDPPQLRRQPWYPSDSDHRIRQSFERRYYNGYAQTYALQADAARHNGWQSIGIYGWQPFRRTWWGLSELDPTKMPDWSWQAYGRRIFESVDIVFPSLYGFYWSPQTVAYTLANSDLNQAALTQAGVDKPVISYYWGLLHGGGSDDQRWWKKLPIPNEEMRAMVALGFFTGQDGFALWGWSADRNEHIPPRFSHPTARARGNSDTLPGYWSVGKTFEATGTDPNSRPIRTTVRRYDALNILKYDRTSGKVDFRIVDRSLGHAGVSERLPVYSMDAGQLAGYLRTKTEPVSAVIEAMALIKPVETILRHGRVHIDVPAQQQFKETLPIIRRVSLGNLHVLATYDPAVIHGNQPRQVILENFDGQKGMALRLPADQQVRLYVVKLR